MSKYEVTTLVCDVCQEEATEQRPVRTKTLTVNKKAVEVEVCDGCWPEDKLTAILAAGRRPGTPPRLLTTA